MRNWLAEHGINLCAQRPENSLAPMWSQVITTVQSQDSADVRGLVAIKVIDDMEDVMATLRAIRNEAIVEIHTSGGYSPMQIASVMKMSKTQVLKIVREAKQEVG